MELRLTEIEQLRLQMEEINAELKAAEYAIRFLLADRNNEKPGFTERMLSVLDQVLGEIHAEKGPVSHAAELRTAIRKLVDRNELIAATPPKPWWRFWR